MAALVVTLSGCSYGKPVGTLSSACPLLASPEAGLYLGDDLVAVEQEASAAATVACTFRRGTEIVLGFSVDEIPARGQSPDQLVYRLGRPAPRGQSTPIQGLGDAAIYFELRQRRLHVLTVAKRTGGNIRVMTFSSSQPISPNRLGALATIALQHL